MDAYHLVTVVFIHKPVMAALKPAIVKFALEVKSVRVHRVAAL